MSTRSRHSGETCQLDDCRKEAIELPLQNNKKLNSKYCYRHTCEVGWGCSKPATKRGSLYCKKHRTCAESGCPAEGRDLYECAMKWYCRKHECPEPNCHRRAKPRHEHTPTSIPQPPPSIVVRNCDVDECPNPPVDDADFCQSHKCNIASCLEEKEFPNGCCGMHQSCQAPGCSQFCRFNELSRKPERFCWQHEQCVTHGCETPCFRDAVHCGAHQCGMDGCKGEKYLWESKSEWCRIHTCGTKGCPAPIPARHPPPTFTSILIRHCREHTCIRPDCYEESVVELGPCQKHSCAEPTCNHNIQEPRTYCDTHECHSRGCLEPSASPSHVSYCAEKHACQWDNDDVPCPDPRVRGGPFPALCSTHAFSQAAMDGAASERMRYQREAEEQAGSEASASASADAAAPRQDQSPPRADDGRRQEGGSRRPRRRHARGWTREWSEDDLTDEEHWRPPRPPRPWS